MASAPSNMCKAMSLPRIFGPIIKAKGSSISPETRLRQSRMRKIGAWSCAKRTPMKPALQLTTSAASRSTRTRIAQSRLAGRGAVTRSAELIGCP
jgi:hypothetical protein